METYLFVEDEALFCGVETAVGTGDVKADLPCVVAFHQGGLDGGLWLLGGWCLEAEGDATAFALGGGRGGGGGGAGPTTTTRGRGDPFLVRGRGAAVHVVFLFLYLFLVLWCGGWVVADPCDGRRRRGEEEGERGRGGRGHRSFACGGGWGRWRCHPQHRRRQRGWGRRLWEGVEVSGRGEEEDDEGPWRVEEAAMGRWKREGKGHWSDGAAAWVDLEDLNPRWDGIEV